MNDKPRRAWFQVHLSTAIVVMFVAGGLIGANITPHRSVNELPNRSDYSRQEVYAIAPMKWPTNEISYGWPLTAYETGVASPVGGGHYRIWKWLSMTINIAICLVTLATFAIAAEWLLRRREGRAP